MTLHSPRSRRLIASLLSLALTPALHAANITWIGSNADWVEGVINNANWTPADEPDADDTAIFNTPNTVNLGTNNTVLALTMSAGIDLLLNGHTLTVNGGPTTLTGASTNLTVGNASIFNADSITLSASSQLRVSGGAVSYAESAAIAILSINATAALLGQGSVSNTDAFTGITSVIVNNGAISAQSLSLLIPPAAGTLTLNATSADARIDLDGAGNGILNVFRNQTLAVNIPVLDGDDFDGDINLFQNAALNIANPWAMDAGTLDVSNGFNAFLTPAGTAFIKGGAFTQKGGTITLATHDSTLQFDAPFTLTAGALVNNGEVIFNANSTITAAANFTMPSSTSSLTVAAGITVNLNQTNFNLDGNGLPTNVVTVNANGRLLLNSGAGADTGLTGAVVLNGGSLSLTNNTLAWIVSPTGTVTTGAGTGVSVISGDPLNSSGTFSIATGSTLVLTNSLTLTGGTYAGAGELIFDGALSVPSTTTLNMTGGAVDLDGRGSDSVGNALSIKAPLTINAATLRSFGKINGGGGTNTLFVDNDAGVSNLGTLTVNLDNPDASWTLNAPGFLTLFNDNAPATLLSGNPLTARGIITAVGDVRSTARINLPGTLTIFTAAEPFHLAGGSLLDPNTIAGGTISGAGILGADTARALRGFGTINTDIDFDGSSELTAQDGTLTLAGAIIDVGTIGTSAADGVLNIPNPWASNVASSVHLLGGTLTGAVATINNALGLSGKGLVLAPLLNETRLEANLAGGTLLVDSTANVVDWDGAGEVGILAASNGGTLHLKDTVDFNTFDGTISASGGTVFTDGFALLLSNSAVFTVANGGIFKSTESQSLPGAVNVGLGLPSEIQLAAGKTLEFAATSNTALFGSLRLNAPNTVIRANATFSGAGTLLNLAGSALSPDAGAAVNVLVQNAGALALAGPAAVGRVDFKDFQQDPTGTLQVQLAGTGLANFDRLVVGGAAQLNGTLAVSLTGGFFPSLGNTFNILSATAGVSGTFASITSNATLNLAAAPVLNLAATFTPTYAPTLVTLTAAAVTYEVQAGAYPQNFTGSGWGLIKTTAGVATLTGNLAHTGPTTVQAGTLVLSPSNNQTAALSILAGAAAVLSGSANAFTRPATLTGGPGAWTSKLDLANSGLVIATLDAGDKAARLATARDQVAFGLPGVNGITSSSALADPTHKAVYVVDNALLGLTTFNGEPVTPFSLLVQATYKGDSNLDRRVDVTDLGVLATYYGQAVGDYGIVRGDFNGDGVVNVTDLGLLATNYGAGTAPGAVFSLDADLAAFSLGAPASATAVPEPTSLTALLLPLTLLLRRRSPRQHK